MLTVYTSDDVIQWDRIVCSFRDYDTYWLWGYVQAFALHGDGTPLLLYYVSPEVRGIQVVMKRDIALDPHFCGRLSVGQYFDFVSPYGYGGWLIEGDNWDELFSAYEFWCRENSIISEFVRFHPVLENHRYSERAYQVVPLGNTVTLDLSSPDMIWSNITSKNRNMIRKAQKNGVKVYSGRSPELYEAFRQIYNGTMDKDHAEKYYYFDVAFYRSLLNDLPRNAQVFYAVYQEQIIAASIILTANGKINYHLSGSLQKFSHLAPTNLILYEVAMWGWANGCRTLYLGGGVGSCEDSLFKFKKSFFRGDELKRFHIGKKIYDEDRYNQLVGSREPTESNFFPKYRA